mmetsp:Transcript_7776/g.17059  ORF Transcript_7776/g.17059 Transcript_7776/m.17059 type:complete len:465 (+) Transcript_7776:33-1427(+)
MSPSLHASLPLLELRPVSSASQTTVGCFSVKEAWSEAATGAREEAAVELKAATSWTDVTLDDDPEAECGQMEPSSAGNEEAQRDQPATCLSPRGRTVEPAATALGCPLHGLSVIMVLAIHGILQERIMTTPYDGEYFRSSLFIVLCNRIIGILGAVLMAVVRGHTLRPQAYLMSYALVSMLNVAASYCQYEALKWVSFPVQVMGKSCKIIPVMMWGVVIAHKTYRLSEWLSAGAIMFGICAFVLGGDISPHHDEHNQTWFGLILLCGWVTADSLTVTAQERLFQKAKTELSNQLLYTNIFSSLVCSVGLIVSDEGFVEDLLFCKEHPRFVLDIASLMGTAVAGQSLVLSMVQVHGAVALATAMSMRQVLSILISCAIFKHSPSLLQACGFLIMFSALLLVNIFKLEDPCFLSIFKKVYHRCCSSLAWQALDDSELDDCSSGGPAIRPHSSGNDHAMLQNQESLA